METKKKAAVLYDHNSVASIHRNLTITDDGRRRRTTTTTIALDLPTTEQAWIFYEPTENEPYAYDDDHIPHQTEGERNTGIKVKATEHAKRYQNSVSIFPLFSMCSLLSATQDVPLKTWIEFRDKYLDECNRLEGRGEEYLGECVGC
jgi:hypothetical protein